MYLSFYQIYNPIISRIQTDDAMKTKLSATVDEALLTFLDSLPGKTRSAKLEHALREFRRIVADRELREQLAAYVEDDEELLEREAWARARAEVMWKD